MDSRWQKIGGEYGEVRASVDIGNLNAYLSKYMPSIKAPIDIKQFKVSQKTCSQEYYLTSLCPKFGQVCCFFPFMGLTSNMAILVKSHIFLDRYQVSTSINWLTRQPGNILTWLQQCSICLAQEARRPTAFADCPSSGKRIRCANSPAKTQFEPNDFWWAKSPYSQTYNSLWR